MGGLAILAFDRNERYSLAEFGGERTILPQVAFVASGDQVVFIRGTTATMRRMVVQDSRKRVEKWCVVPSPMRMIIGERALESSSLDPFFQISQGGSEDYRSSAPSAQPPVASK
jgi:hypothetical protein